MSFWTVRIDESKSVTVAVKQRNGWEHFEKRCSAGCTLQSTGLQSKGLYSELFWTGLFSYEVYSIHGSLKGGESEKAEGKEGV